MKFKIAFIFILFARPCTGQYFHFSGMHSITNTYDYRQSLANVSLSANYSPYYGDAVTALSLAHSPLRNIHADINLRNAFNVRAFDVSSSIGFYKSWFPNTYKKNVYNDVFSLNVNLGYKYSNGGYVRRSNMIQHALFIKTGAILYYKKLGFNFSYRFFGFRTSKITLTPGKKYKSENEQALRYRANPKLYSSIDLRFILKFRKILYFVHLQKLDITPIYPIVNKATYHFGIEYNFSSVIFPKRSKVKRFMKPKRKKRKKKQ